MPPLPRKQTMGANSSRWFLSDDAISFNATRITPRTPTGYAVRAYPAKPLRKPWDRVPKGEAWWLTPHYRSRGKGTQRALGMQAKAAHRGERVGEAGHPGPSTPAHTQEHATFAITNPTAIINKGEIYSSLRYHFCACSETAATLAAQTAFRRELKDKDCKVFWSSPAPYRHERKDGKMPLRGKATGVAAISRIPCQYQRQEAPTAPELAGRYLKLIVQVGSIQVFVAVLYGPQACHQGAASWNESLWRQVAEDISVSGMQAIILGDFNSTVSDISAAQILWNRGYRDLPFMHQALHGEKMGPTCKDATTPDNALISPGLLGLVQGIEVEKELHFDTHRVVYFHMKVPKSSLIKTVWRLPKEFTALIEEPSGASFSLCRTCTKTTNA